MLKQRASEYAGYRQPGIRLREPLLPSLAGLDAGRTEVMAEALHAFDKAHAVMLVEEELIALSDGQKILRVLREMDGAGVSGAKRDAGGGMHSGERYLIRILGEEIGGRLHLGRSSGDVSSVAINVLQRESLLETMSELNRLRRTLIGLARQHTGTILPGYSFGQHAQPITVAHMWLAWTFTLERDFARLWGAFERVNRSPAGAVIMTGTDFAINRYRTAELLGFDAVHENAQDAILELTTDDILDVVSVFATMYHSLAKWTDDVIQWSTTEFGFVEIPDRFCTTSSIMMQKKNVTGPAEIKGAAAEALACVITCHHALKGPTGLAINERYYGLDMFWRVAANSTRDLRWFGDLLPALCWRADHALRQAGRHWATATDLAGELVRQRDMPWRSAHQIVGILVRLAEERGISPESVTSEMLDEAADMYHGTPAGLGDGVIAQALDPSHFITSRALMGGPAPEESLRQATVAEAAVRDAEHMVEKARGRVTAATARLEAAIDKILGEQPDA